MNELTFVEDKVETAASVPPQELIELRAAHRLAKHDHARGMAALNGLFRTGIVPEPSLQGRYVGELLALDIAPGLTQLFQSLTDAWMPWLGKKFDAAHQSGENIFTRDLYWLARLFNPLYRGFVIESAKVYRGFAFHTYLAPGLMDPDQQVLKIDYNLKENPSLTVRRVLDELVQLSDGLYLGKAHVKWWWRPQDGWQTVAYFMLTEDRLSFS